MGRPRLGLAFFAIGMLGSCAVETPVPAPEPAQCTGSVDGPITLMTYNIRVGYGVARPGVRPQYLLAAPKTLAPVVAAIKSVDPDVVALQEVLTTAQGRTLAQALGMHYAFASHLGPVPLWGTAILSKCPLTVDEVVPVSDEAMNRRKALVATVNFPDGPLDIVSVHRDPDVNDGSQLARLAGELPQGRSGPILMGDFNVGPYDRRLRAFNDRFEDTARDVETATARRAREIGTVTSRRQPNKRIDYIFVPEGAYRVIDAGVTSEAYREASDHRGYWAVIEAR